MALNFIRRSLRGTNLEVFKFGMYLSFPIGYMYYFGTNLEDRFTVPGFWPTQEQSHKIPFEKEEIKAEVERLQRQMREDALHRQRMENEARLREAKLAFGKARHDAQQEASS